MLWLHESVRRSSGSEHHLRRLRKMIDIIRSRCQNLSGGNGHGRLCDAQRAGGAIRPASRTTEAKYRNSPVRPVCALLKASRLTALDFDSGQRGHGGQAREFPADPGAREPAHSRHQPALPDGAAGPPGPEGWRRACPVAHIWPLLARTWRSEASDAATRWKRLWKHQGRNDGPMNGEREALRASPSQR